MITLEDYSRYVDREIIEELHLLAKGLRGIKILHVNSTKKGGGVAEILSRLVPLTNSLGIETNWEVFFGSDEFFRFTKKLHNMLHMPNQGSIDSEDINIYLKTTYDNMQKINTENYDVVFIHDPQPLGLVVKKMKNQKWIWRCHIDTSTPDEKAWSFLELFVNSYDACIFHIPEFVYKNIRIPPYIIPPSIDPLHPKNSEIDEEFIAETVARYGVDASRPIILQVSRFDRLKDPIGVYKAYRLVKKKYDCQLVLLGSYATDDPEGEEVYKEVLSLISEDKDAFALNLPPDSHREVNAFQRMATVVLQKSIREGFGLVVSEAMWKGKPVIGGNTGGIRRQIVEGYTGFLVNTIEGTAYRTRQLLSDESLRRKMGEYAREWVRHRFLIIRHLRDYLMLIKSLL